MMKNTTKLKAIVLSLLMLIGLIPLTLFAQSDGFISNDDDVFGRDAWVFTVNTQNFGATPVGSGLLILGIAGAGYAVAKRRRSKRDITKGTALLLAGLMLVGMTNCRKEVDTIASVGDKVHITVKVNGGGKAGVNPANGQITFNNDDVMYVGYNGAKVGELTYSTGGSSFGGDITITQSGDQPLYFYYLGGPAATVVDATHYTANISDQTSNYPVIASGPSTTNYEDGTKAYTVNLTNKCGFVKFATNVNSTTVNVGGMNTKATLDFSTGEITPGTEGTVSFSTDGEGTGWAILLEQSAVDDATVTASGYSDGTCDVPAVTNNMLYSTGVEITMAAAAPALNLTNPAVGQVIGDDGKNYAYASLPAGVTPVAMICYVSGSSGLALALSDETGTMNWSTAGTTCAAHTPAFTGGTWKLATKDEWNNMITAAGSYTALRDGFSSVGGTNMKSGEYDYYWSGSEGDDAGLAWNIRSANGVWYNNDKNDDSSDYVRACLTFTITPAAKAAAEATA